MAQQYGPDLERRIFFGKILYEVDSSDIPTIIITVSFVTLFVNWYNYRLLPLIRQFFLVPNSTNQFVACRQ
jgi:hypothetical protein